ncbi:hypothetical protein [Amycolatopsis magusensis]|uniref:Zinc-ribbon domain-containing protein n=1 Tax=Amycolatopsis magusensis TaxID=882444 RepID=A0ABS4PYB8_9PSEU|nr:hypothetical protein [Amycolatopsis magusensis]MBP2184428.1 hypothetical protein [Amycolatopsis magusensis]MDI5975665.1 hypothetical protein [Amycolatopsis magusensis]
MNASADDAQPEWVTIAQRRHRIVSWHHTALWTYARSACGQLLTASLSDRASDAPVCVPCAALGPEPSRTGTVVIDPRS